MRLLFICGATIDHNKLLCASWIKSIITNLDDSYDITLASTADISSINRMITVEKKEIHLFSISAVDSSEVLSLQLLETKADVVIIFGTENPNHLRIINVCQQLNFLDKTVVFAQGLCCVCAQHYAEGVPEGIIKRYTIRDFLRRKNIAKEREDLQHRAANEKSTLELTSHFIGRTTMDKAILRKYNCTANYYKCNDILRDSFYEDQWKYDSCEKHRIFISQFYYSLKGFHFLLDAVAQLKDKYPDVRIAAAGYNPIQKSLIKKEIKDSSYIRYIKTLIKRFQLQGNIELLGLLSEEDMKKEYLKSNVFIMPSTIENSPNSMAEAMMLGVPTIASDVGGVTDFAKHNEEAYIYPSSATYLLAYYIDKVFAAQEKAEALGKKGRERAEKEYDREKNIARLEEVFRTIAGV